jgi:hypothetical protein
MQCAGPAATSQYRLIIQVAGDPVALFLLPQRRSDDAAVAASVAQRVSSTGVLANYSSSDPSAGAASAAGGDISRGLNLFSNPGNCTSRSRSRSTSGGHSSRVLSCHCELESHESGASCRLSFAPFGRPQRDRITICGPATNRQSSGSAPDLSRASARTLMRPAAPSLHFCRVPS